LARKGISDVSVIGKKGKSEVWVWARKGKWRKGVSEKEKIGVASAKGKGMETLAQSFPSVELPNL
jgi:hypothetical protein